MINTLPIYASQDEMGLHIALEAEKSFNEMLESAGIAELHEFEESGVVTEAKSGSLKDAFLGWLNKVWEAIKKAYDTVLEFVKKHTDKVREKLSEIAAKDKAAFVKRAGLLNEKGKDGKKKNFGKAHTWDGFNDVINSRGPVWKAINVYDNAVSKLPAVDYSKNLDGSKIKTSGEALTNASDSARAKIQEVFENVNKEAKTALGVGSLESAKIQAKVKKIITGKEIDVDKNYITSHAEELFGYGTDFGKTASDVKKNINAVKKNFDSTKRELEAFYRKIHGNDTVIASVIKNMKQGKLVLTAISNATVSSVRTRCIEASGIVLRVAVAGRAKEEAANESAIVPSAFQTELASLFEI